MAHLYIKFQPTRQLKKEKTSLLFWEDSVIIQSVKKDSMYSFLCMDASLSFTALAV